MKSIKRILWLIQSNQVTPTIVSFLETFQTRIQRYVDLIFIVPESSSDILPKLKSLRPQSFKITTKTAANPHQAFSAKREALSKGYFSEGLSVADTLLLDDLGGCSAVQTTFELAPPEQTCGLILQIPTPLGSSDIEERIFHSGTLWARQHRIVSIGYELLPLDTNWTLSPSLPDGVITRYPESCAHMKNHLDHNHIWQIPSYEAAIFSPVATSFHLNGLKASYHYRNQHAIPADRTVLYLPHNVAMVYEYKKLVQTLVPFGKRLHLMFSVGKDQVRGSYTQKQTIELIYKEELKQIASYSFHDINNPWEMMMSDAVVACSACISTLVGEKELPCIIYAPQLPAMTRGNKKRVSTEKQLSDEIKKVINLKKNTIELADIFMLLTQTGKTNV